MGYYLYCIGRELSPPPEGLAGFDGAAIHRSRLAGLDTWLSPADRRPDATLEAVRHHHSIVEAAADCASALLPVRFGQWNTSSEGLESALADRRADYESAMDRVAGAVEIVITVLDTETSKNSSVRPAAAGTGRAYMEALASRFAQERQREQRADQVLEAIRSAVQNHIRDARIRSRAGSDKLLSIAHLVATHHVDAYHTALSPCKLTFPGLHFLSSGPWPPYSFVE